MEEQVWEADEGDRFGKLSTTDSEEFVGETQWSGDDLEPNYAWENGKSSVHAKRDVGSAEVIIQGGGVSAFEKRDDFRSDVFTPEIENKGIRHEDLGSGEPPDSNGPHRSNNLIKNDWFNGSHSFPRGPTQKPTQVDLDAFKTCVAEAQERKGLDFLFEKKAQSLSNESIPFPPGWGPHPLFSNLQNCGTPLPPFLGDPPSQEKSTNPAATPPLLQGQVSQSDNLSQTKPLGDSPSVTKAIQTRPSRQGRRKRGCAREESSKGTLFTQPNCSISLRLSRSRKISKKNRKQTEKKEATISLNDPLPLPPTTIHGGKKSRGNRTVIDPVKKANCSEAEEILKMGADFGLHLVAQTEEAKEAVQQMMDGQHNTQSRAGLNKKGLYNEAA